jgi:hypothetical protein
VPISALLLLLLFPILCVMSSSFGIGTQTQAHNTDELANNGPASSKWSQGQGSEKSEKRRAAHLIGQFGQFGKLEANCCKMPNKRAYFWLNS